MSIGQKIREARKKKGMTLEDLASVCGKKKSWLSSVENDALKGGADPDLLIQMAEVLGDSSILIYALLHNPICQRIIPRAFAPLNHIKTDPSAILTKMQEELEEAIESTKILARVFSHAEPQTTPNYEGVVMANLEQIVDVSRCIEEMFSRLKECAAISEEQHLEIYVRQQAKVEARGHHKQAEVA